MFIRIDLHDRYVFVVVIVVLAEGLICRAISLHLVCFKQLEAALGAAGASPRSPVPFHFNLVNISNLILEHPLLLVWRRKCP